GGQGGASSGGAFGGQAAAAPFTGAAGDRPGHHDPVSRGQVAYARSYVQDLGHALVADREGPLEGDSAADGADHRVDDAQGHSGLHGAGDGTGDGQGVTGAAGRHERPRVGGGGAQ